MNMRPGVVRHRTRYEPSPVPAEHQKIQLEKGFSGDCTFVADEEAYEDLPRWHSESDQPKQDAQPLGVEDRAWAESPWYDRAMPAMITMGGIGVAVIAIYGLTVLLVPHQSPSPTTIIEPVAPTTISPTATASPTTAASPTTTAYTSATSTSSPITTDVPTTAPTNTAPVIIETPPGATKPILGGAGTTSTQGAPAKTLQTQSAAPQVQAPGWHPGIWAVP